MCAAKLAQVRSFHAGSMLRKTPGVVAVAVPADAEAVAVRRLRAQLRVQALVDERVLRLVEQLLDQDGRSGVGEPAAHGVHDRAPAGHPHRLDGVKRALTKSGRCAARGNGGCSLPVSSAPPRSLEAAAEKRHPATDRRRERRGPPRCGRTVRATGVDWTAVDGRAFRERRPRPRGLSRATRQLRRALDRVRARRRA